MTRSARTKTYGEGEAFTKSDCACEFCIGTHLANREWETFAPETALQRRMMDVVKKIEDGVHTGPRIMSPAIHMETRSAKAISLRGL